MHVPGGQTYTHQLWDYEVNDFRANYPGVTLIYSVERVSVNDNWSIVLFSPKQAISNNTSCVNHTLQRRQLVHTVTTFDGSKRVSAMIKHNGPDAVLSLSAPGEVSSVRISAKTQTILGARMRISKLQLCDLIQLLAPDFGMDTRLAQSLIYNCYPAVMPAGISRSSLHREVDLALSYGKLSVPTLIPDEKVAITSLSPPVLAGVCAPLKSKANDVWCVDKRITSVANKQTKFIGDYVMYQAEFLNFYLPTPGVLYPVAVSEVYEAQSRPTQRANNDRAIPSLSSWAVESAGEIKSFQKAELYPEPKDPRNISTLPTEHCLLSSQYTRALSAHSKQFNWYAFGQHPNDTARRVHMIAAHATHLIETDFSRFDGTHSLALHEFELAIKLRAFPLCEHERIRALQQTILKAKCRTSFGVKYQIGGSRPSGADDTSYSNTLDNAYINYCALRKSGMSPQEAWDALGIYGGDDGVTADVPPKTLEMVCTNLALSLKAKQVQPTGRLSFLGRVYPNPAGHHGHMADLPRQLPKLSAYAGTVLDKPLALQNKAAGHLVVDPDTPILADWARMIQRIYGEHKFVETELTSYFARGALFNKEVGRGAHKMSREEMMAVAVESLDVDTATIDRYCEHLRTITDINQLLPLRAVEVKPLPPGVRMGNDIGIDAKRAAPPVPLIGQDYMATRDFEKKQLSDFLRKAAAPIGEVTSFIDATAFKGGDTLTLARTFTDAKAVAIEIDTAHLVTCSGNFRAVYPTRAYLPILGDASVVLRTQTADLVYFDPPWTGGKDYEQVGPQMPVLGMPLSTLMAETLNNNRAKVVVAKVPKTIDMATYNLDMHTFNCDSTPVKNRKGECAFILLSATRQVLADEAPVVSVIPIMPKRPVVGPPNPRKLPSAKKPDRPRKPRANKVHAT
jgi:hypothetical protein